jgi:hypothetical protein
MIIATLTNSEGCDFDSVRLPDSRGINRKKAAIAAAKRWAAGRGGRYVLNIHEAEEIAGHVWTVTLGEWGFRGNTRKAVALQNWPMPKAASFLHQGAKA